MTAWLILLELEGYNCRLCLNCFTVLHDALVQRDKNNKSTSYISGKYPFGCMLHLEKTSKFLRGKLLVQLNYRVRVSLQDIYYFLYSQPLRFKTLSIYQMHACHLIQHKRVWDIDFQSIDLCACVFSMYIYVLGSIPEPWFDMYLKDRRPVSLTHNPFITFTDDPNPEYMDQVFNLLYNINITITESSQGNKS